MCFLGSIKLLCIEISLLAFENTLSLVEMLSETRMATIPIATEISRPAVDEVEIRSRFRNISTFLLCGQELLLLRDLIRYDTTTTCHLGQYRKKEASLHSIDNSSLSHLRIKSKGTGSAFKRTASAYVMNQ